MLSFTCSNWEVENSWPVSSKEFYYKQMGIQRETLQNIYCNLIGILKTGNSNSSSHSLDRGVDAVAVDNNCPLSWKVFFCFRI
jgi:hypothetical protein